ncbi:MAG: hypothetical protein V1742_06960 [Pseudomonadota bacterium]
MPLKPQVKRLLQEEDWEALLSLLSEDRRVVTALNRLLFDDEEIIRWRAVLGLGLSARHEPFFLEKIISRLVYTMNDDAGQIGWMAPQALGEICANDPDLVEDFFPQVIGSMDVPVFRAGAIWAVGRVAGVRPDLVEGTGPILMQQLSDPSPEVRGLAVWTLGRLGWSEAAGPLARLGSDQGEFKLFKDGKLQTRTVGQTAEEALAALLAD